MNILLVNNSVRGSSGIDAVVKSEERALLRLGHSVHLYTRDNSEFTVARGLERTRLALATLYSYRSRREVRALCAQHAFDVIHFHNLAPLLTGAVYDGTRDSKAFIVQHLHNYRAFCPAAYAFRHNQFCSDCTRGAFLPCAWHGCYRHSRAASSALVMVRWMDWLHGRQSGAAPDAWIAVSSAVSNRSIEPPAFRLIESKHWIIPLPTWPGSCRNHYGLISSRPSNSSLPVRSSGQRAQIR